MNNIEQLISRYENTLQDGWEERVNLTSITYALKEALEKDRQAYNTKIEAIKREIGSWEREIALCSSPAGIVSMELELVGLQKALDILEDK